MLVECYNCTKRRLWVWALPGTTAATRVQKMLRGYVARKAFEATARAVRRIQACTRGFFARRTVLKVCALSLQSRVLLCAPEREGLIRAVERPAFEPTPDATTVNCLLGLLHTRFSGDVHARLLRSPRRAQGCALSLPKSTAQLMYPRSLPA